MVRSAQKRFAAAALLLLSLLWAVGLLRKDAFPNWSDSPVPPLLRQAVPLAILGLVAGAVIKLRPKPRPSSRLLLTAVTVGLGMFVLPALLIAGVHELISPLTRAGLFALTPVFAVVLEPYLSRSQPVGGENRRLLAALVGFSGALCLFPVGIPESITSAAAYCAVIAASLAVAAANCAATGAMVTVESLPAFTAITAFAAAVSLVAASAMIERPQWHAAFASRQQVLPDLIWAAGVEVPALALLFWLMPRMTASRMATRFLWPVVFAVPIAAVVFHTSPVRRSWLGVLLMAAGAGYLLLVSERASEAPRLSLR
jgi:drug/metabolite transporter (DMT)-like permease